MVDLKEKAEKEEKNDKIEKIIILIELIKTKVDINKFEMEIQNTKAIFKVIRDGNE